MSAKIKLLGIYQSTQKNKKYVAVFSNGLKINFGASGYEDYTTHNDHIRKQRYILRHSKNENWNNPYTAGSLSRFILWNKRTLTASINDYKKRFNL